MMIIKIKYFNFIWLVLVGCLVGCSESSSVGEGPLVDFGTSVKIIGGEAVASRDPIAGSTVMLLNLDSGDLCTGTLISKRVAVTAAHCLPSEIKNLRVFFSLDPLAETSTSEGHVVTKIETHDAYNPSRPLDSIDLAVIQLSLEAPPPYQPVKLASSFTYKAGQNVVLAGYGKDSVTQGEGFGKLRKALVFISNIQGPFLEVDQSRGRGICDGDSGGPVFFVTETAVSLMGVAKLVYDKNQTAAENCLTVSQFTALTSPEIQAWIENFVQKSLADIHK